MSEEITMNQLLEAGVHFGHQTTRWNPKNEEVHLWSPQRNPYRQPPENVDSFQGSRKIFKDPGATGQKNSVCRDQKTGPGA